MIEALGINILEVRGNSSMNPSNKLRTSLIVDELSFNRFVTDSRDCIYSMEPLTFLLFDDESDSASISWDSFLVNSGE